MRITWSGKYIEAVVDGTWEYVQRASGLSAAVILAVTADDELILVEQYRPPVQKSCLELPAGIVGDEGPEEAADAARRELEEETGFHAETLCPLGEFLSSPGLTSESFQLFRANGLSRTGAGGGVDGENITVHVVPRAGLTDFIEEKRNADVMIDVRLLACLSVL